MTEAATTTKQKPVCTVCGSDDIKCDAWASWDANTQEWVLATTHDDKHCEKCGGECSVEWVSLNVSQRLFNCCTAYAEPDWSHYKSLVVGGCKDDEGLTIGGKPDDEAEFWTVYARHQSGCAEAITDCETRADADIIAAELSSLSSLPIGD